MKTLKQFIKEYNQENGYDCDLKDELFETFESCFPVVAQPDRDEHRWYFNVDKVVKINIDNEDRFFLWTDCETKGEDSSREDCGWEVPDLDDIEEVRPHEVTVIKYY